MEIDNGMTNKNLPQTIIYDSFKHSVHLDMIRNDIDFYKINTVLKLIGYSEDLEKQIENLIESKSNKFVDEIFLRYNFNKSLYKNSKSEKITQFIDPNISGEISDLCISINKNGKASLKNLKETYDLIRPDLKVSKSYIRLCLIKENFKYRKTPIRNPIICSNEMKLRRLYVADILISRIKQDYVIISIDETPLSSFVHADYYWRNNNESCLYKEMANCKGNSMFMAITQDRIANYYFSNEINTSFDFWYFVNETIENLYSDNKYKERINANKILVFCDGASIHFGKKARKEILKFNLEVLYNTPYDAQQNPIERTFRLTKTKLKTMNLRNIDEVKDAYRTIINETEPYEIKKCWLLSLRDLMKAIE